MAKKINWEQLRKVYEIQDQREKEKVAQQKRDEFNLFLTESEDYLQSERKAYDSADFNTFSGANNAFRSGVDSWRGRSNAARSYVSSLKDTVSEEEYKAYLDHLNRFDADLKNLEDLYTGKSDYFSEFKTADEVSDFKFQTKYEGADLGMVDRNIAAGDISEEEREWLKKNRLYFASEKELSEKIAKTKADLERYTAEGLGFFDKSKADPAVENYKNTIAEMELLRGSKEKERKRIEKLQALTSSAKEDPDFLKKSEYIAPTGEGEFNTRFVDQVNNYAPEVYTPAGGYGFIPTVPDPDVVNEYAFRREKALEMSEEEKRLYTYFFNEEQFGRVAPGTAEEYLKAIELDKRATEKRKKELKEFAKEDPVGSSLASVILSPLEIPTTLMDVASGLAGKGINENDYYHQIARSTSAAREGVSEDMTDFGSFLYNTGMSMLDTGYNMVLGGGSGLTTALMGIGAAGDAIIAAKDRGVSDEKAVMTGIFAGAAEAAFEKFSIGNLKAMASNGGAGLKNFLKNWMKQAGVEASEETATELSNIMSDYIINRSESDYGQRIKGYMDSGLTYEEAARKAATDGAMQVLEAAAGGALSGGVFGLGGTTVGAVNNYTVGRDLIKGKQVKQTADLASTFDADSLTAKRLAEMQKKTAKTGKESASYAGALYQAMAQESFEKLSEAKRSNIETSVREKLAEKGLNTDEKTVRAVAKKIFGKIYGAEKLTTSENKITSREEYSKAVDELAADLELYSAFYEDASIKEAEGTVAKLEEIAAKSEANGEIAKIADRMKESADVADLKNVTVENNGDVYITDAEGKKTLASDVELTEDAATAVAYTDGMSPAKKRAFLSQYAESGNGIPLDDFHLAFDYAYTKGLSGAGVKEAVEYAGPTLTEQGAFAAFKKGLDVRGEIKAEKDAEIKSFGKTLGIEREGGKVDDKAIRYAELAPNDPRRAVVSFVKVVAQTTGRNFVFFHSTAAEQESGKENGRYEPETNTIYIDINAGINETQRILVDQVLPTVSHELVHIFAVEDPEGFKALSDLVFAGLKESTGHTRSYLISEKINSILETDKERFEGKSEETRRAIAEEEIVARACEDRLANSRLMKEFIEEMENKESGLAQKFSNFLGEAIARLKKIFQQIAAKLSYSKEAQSLRKLTDHLEAIQSQYDALLERRTTESTTVLTDQQQKNTSARGVMSAERGSKQNFEEDKYFARQIDKWEELKHGQYVKVGVLQKENPLVLVGLQEGDLRYDVDKIKKNMEKHADYLTKDLLKMIPNVISKPVAISEYSKDKNTISVFFDHYIGGSPIMVGVTISKNRAGNEISKIRTFNVRSDVENLITDKNILYLNEDKKRTRKFFQACGIQVPLGGKTFGFIRSISRDKKTVNPQNSEDAKGTMKSDRGTMKSDRESAYMDAVKNGDTETAQRMVDEAAKAAGYDKRVLHGTRSFGFTKLDTSFSDDKISFFATPSAETARTYSGLESTRGITEEANKDEVKAITEKAEGKIKERFEEWAKKARLAGMQSKYLKADEIYDSIGKITNDFLNGKISQYRMEEKQEAYLQKLIKKAYDKRANGGESFGKWKNTAEYNQLLFSGLDFVYTFNDSKTLYNKVQKAGNYDLYANTDGLLVIEGNGANWNDLSSDLLPNIASEDFKEYQDPHNENRWTTRNVSRYAYDNGYKGVLFKDIVDAGGAATADNVQPADVYAFFDPKSQLKSADTVTYDDNGNVIPLSERFNAKNDDIRYADRAKYMTARELLLQAMADEEIKNSEIYSPLLREYANRVTELDKKYMALEAAEHDYVASIDAFDSEEKQAKYKYNMDQLSREISRIERDLTKQEESPELKRLVLREKAATRKQTEKEARQDTASRMSNLRKSIERKSTLERIEAKTKLLSKKLTENTRKSHIPDDLKQPLDKFLSSIKGSIRDLQYGYGTPAEVEFQEATPASEQSTFVKDTKNALKELRKAIEQNSQIPIVQEEKQATDTTEGSQGAAYSGILMIDPHILDEMESLASSLEKLTDDGITYELAELDLDQAKSLDKILTSVSRAINSIDRAFAGQGKEKISDLGESSMAYMKPIIDESKKKGSSKLAKWLKDATTWEEMTPYTAFSQFGEGGRTIYGNILRGWGDYAFYAKQIIDFAKKTWTPEEAKKWSETVKTYELAGQEFEATTAQMMYLYLLSKREQGKLHLNGDGFVIGDYTITKAGVKKTVEAKKVSAIKSTEKQRDAFFDRYLPKGSREREVAETMQRFLADTSGAWGNELSYKLYGYRAFTDPNYVPIVVDPTKLSASAGDFEGGLYRLMNMGFTKPLNPKANNSVFAVDLFEVFAAHAADMAKYRSLALPAMDAIRWMNYSPTFELEDGSVERDPNNLQSVMGAAYGTSAFNYVKQFIMDLNGSNGDKVNSMEALAASLTRAYKTAAVGANLKVVALQPTSYLRALAVLDKSSLLKAFSYMGSEDEKGKADGKKANKAFNQATQNSGMALWKSLGYYDVGIGRNLTDQIKRYEPLYDKALDLSMKFAAKADEMTLGVLFKACQIQLIDSGKAAGLSREELLKAAGELLDKVIVRTQVVDSTVTRSQLMRSKSKFTKNLTAFMSEPTVAYNLILQGAFDMSHDLRSGMSFKQALQNNRRTLKKNFAAYAATALAAAAVETLFAALRRREDEDEEAFIDGILNGLLENSKTFGGKLLENANPITMIPMIGDLFEKAWNTFSGKQNYSDNMEYEGIQSVWETVASVSKLIEEGGFTVEKLFSTIDDGTKAASYLTGLPIANAIREVKTVWNNTIGEWFDVMWDMRAPSASSELEKAFKKGDMRQTVDGLINQKYLELQEERPNVSPSELRDRAKSSVKSSATAFFKKRYLDAFKKDDRKKMDEIRTAMRQTGLYDHANQTAFEWAEDYREDRREKGLD